MKMHYRQRKNKNKTFLWLGAVVIITLIIFVFSFASSIALDTANPILRMAHNMSTRIERGYSRIVHGRENAETRELLVQYKKALEMLKIEHELIVSENEMLRKELGLRRTSDVGNVSAPILSYPPITPFDVILIDAGSKEGLTEGDKVFAGDWILIGTVKEVAEHTALVNLFSLPERKTEGLLSRTATAVVLEGRGNGAFEFTAPEGFDIEVGDTIVSPGSNRYVLGRVVAIVEDVNGSFSTIFIEQPLNIKNIQWVRIETVEAE